MKIMLHFPGFPHWNLYQNYWRPYSFVSKLKNNPIKEDFREEKLISDLILSLFQIYSSWLFLDSQIQAAAKFEQDFSLHLLSHHTLTRRRPTSQLTKILNFFARVIRPIASPSLQLTKLPTSASAIGGLTKRRLNGILRKSNFLFLSAPGIHCWITQNELLPH